MKPTVLHIRASNFTGGPEKQIMGHIRTCGRYRHRVVTFSENGRANPFADDCRKLDIDLHVIPTRNGFDPAAVFSLRRLFKSTRPMVICTHGYKPAVLALLSRLGSRIPVVMFARGHTAENRKVAVYESIERRAFLHADAVVAVSNGYAKYLVKQGIDPKKISVVHNATDPPQPVDAIRVKEKRRELGIEDQAYLIATAGRLSPEKDQKTLISAFATINKRYPSTRLVLLGDGPLQGELEHFIRHKRIENAQLLGFRKDILQILSAVDLFVLPSLTEGLPNVVLEAFSCSKPVVATSVGGVPELVQDGRNGYIVSPGDEKMLTEAISRCIANPGKSHAMGAAGFQAVISEFTFPSQAEKLERIYKTVSRRSANEGDVA